MSLADCKILELPKISDARGDLGVIEGNKHIPFDIRRVYYLYNIASGQSRGGHAHKALRSVMIAMSGSFDVVLDDGTARKTFTLSHPAQALYLSPMIWREVHNFSQGAVCLVLASDVYDEADYIRDYQAFLSYLQEARK